VKKTSIYLVRHGEVENPNHIIYGRLPGFKLSDRGRYQAEKIGEWFRPKEITHIFSSPLLRAKQTARLISGGKIPISISRRFLEADYKKWEGLTADMRKIEDVEEYVKNPAKSVLGENLAQIEKRMRGGIKMAVKRFRGKGIIIVSHADPILVTRLSFESKSLSNINRCDIRNASVTTLEFDENDNFIDSRYNVVVDARKDLP
jgi:broad specificity phosphatase PhoE